MTSSILHQTEHIVRDVVHHVRERVASGVGTAEDNELLEQSSRALDLNDQAKEAEVADGLPLALEGNHIAREVAQKDKAREEDIGR
ncbi:hypothetical protein EXIGLDRAFT_840918, partial [Exidia glandulosa HHB12029]